MVDTVAATTTTAAATPAAGTVAAGQATQAASATATAAAGTDAAAAAATTTTAAKTETAAATSLIGDAASAEKNGHDAAGQAVADKVTADKAAADKVIADKAAADKAAALAWKPADLKLPEGFTADDKGLAAFAELGTKHGITKDVAQELMGLYVDQLKAGNEASEALWNTMQADNQAKMKADPDFGGAKLDASLKTIAKVIDNPDYGGKDAKEIREALAVTGAGNHPALFRLLTRMSSALTEGKPVTGQAPTTQLADPAKALYPNLPG